MLDCPVTQVFAMLGMPMKGPDAVTRDNLTLRHFLDKADALIAKMEEIKKLDAQARS